MPLREWQQAIQQHVLHAEFPAHDMRLAIYHQAYRLRLAEALRSNFPALHKALGDDNFDAMASHYLEHHPSHHPSIRWFGDELPEWLARTMPYQTNVLFAELAHFEWSVRHTIDAADADRIDIAALNTVDPTLWSELAFGLHPSLTLATYSLNVPPLCEALLQDDDSVTPSSQTLHWLIYRRVDQLSNWRSLSTSEYHALLLVKQGKSFGDLCESLVAQYPDDENAALTQIAQWLRQWIEEGILTRR